MEEPIEVKNNSVIEGIREEAKESEQDIQDILDIAGFSLDELKGIENPNILVLGVGPYPSEIKLLQKWSQKEGKELSVDFVDRYIPIPEYLEYVYGLRSDDHFRMNAFEMDFSDFTSDKKYNVIFLLRFSDLSRISEDVFAKVVESLEENGVFIMSGGLNDRFYGNALHNGKMRLEKAEQVKFSTTDIYGKYIGKNSVINLRKIGHGV